ncbi:hypothetical protein BX667DRAFT_501952 [Coemansia mojavensis]|nr:hypothetical protein BX667DRAFT_501952 [Coemansia mojavensis]
MNILTPHDKPALRILAITLALVGLFISLTTIFLCAWLCIKQKKLRNMTLIRVIFLLQVLEALKCIYNLIGINVDMNNDAGCRVFVFFMLVLLSAPLNLSVFCILHLWSVLTQKICPSRPRKLAIAILVVYSILPQLFTLFIPPKVAGMDSYCEFSNNPGRRLFIFKWLIFYVWVGLACIAGIVGVSSVIFVIKKRSKGVRQRICSESTLVPQSESSASAEAAFAINSQVSKPSAQLGRRGSLSVIAKTLQSMIWFLVVPIVYLGFNTVLSIVWYCKGRISLTEAIVDKILQFLAAPLFALSFYVNPSVRRALRQHRDGESANMHRHIWNLKEITNGNKN